MAIIGPDLSSRQNPAVKYARSLQQRKFRYRERAFLVEGVRLFADAMKAGANPQLVLLNEERLGSRYPELLESLADSSARVHRVTSHVLDFVADTQESQGIVAVFPFPEVKAAPVHRLPLYIVADGLKDPGNLGTLIRSALGAGAQAVYASPQTVDPVSPKVVRGAMGAHFRLPIRLLNWSEPNPVLLSCPQRIAAEAHAEIAFDAVDWRRPSVLVIGSEADGISASARSFITGSVSIPLEGGLESLNAGVAASVILFEAARQRRHHAPDR